MVSYVINMDVWTYSTVVEKNEDLEKGKSSVFSKTNTINIHR